MKKCPKCNAIGENDSTRFCPNCGAELFFAERNEKNVADSKTSKFNKLVNDISDFILRR
jgi:ribosomal protein S27AE